MSYKVLKHITLGHAHTPTGKTRHTFAGMDLGPPTSLRIAQYEGDFGFYLLHVDAAGGDSTDTYHDSMEGAMAQAELEFNVKAEDWRPWHGQTPHEDCR